MTREELKEYIIHERELNMIPHHTYIALIDGIDELEQDQKEIYSKGYADGQRALLEHIELCKEEQEPKYCDRNICLKNEYNNIGCEDCEVTKSQEPTTKNDLGVDCISREQALNEFCIYNPYDSIGVDKVRSYLKALPSVTPQEPKTGHWIENEKQTHVEKIYHCSECGFEAWGEWERTNYCGGCGARMSEVSE